MPEPLDPNAWRHTVRTRLLFVTIAFCAWAAVIEGKLLYLQVYSYDFLKAEANGQQLQLIDMPAPRGDLLDRHGRLLAYSVDADSIFATLSEIKSAPVTVDALCRALQDCTPQERDRWTQRFKRGKGFARVRRWVSVDQARRVAVLKLPGISFLKEPRRYYPNRELAAHVLGYVGTDRQDDKERQKGLGGIEARYDRLLRGQDAKALIQKDGKGNTLSRIGEPPVPGDSLELTIDETLQHIAERELKAGVQEHNAVAGSVVIMDPATGEVLAMANEPTFNPNEYSQAPDEARRNRAVQDQYEPGSTFKMITATAGLEEKVVTPETMIATGNGVLKMESGRVVRDTHGHGTIPFRDVIALSSNIGSIQVGWRLGPERLGKYVSQFGFGSKLSPDFDGEHRGQVWPVALWKHDDALASVSMGYQIGVTPLQMAAAASAIANGGELLEPRIVRAVIKGNKRLLVPRKVVRRVASAHTFTTLTSILEEVVESGTAKATQVEGYRIAGKTGTSAKLVGSHYSKSDYNASFVGFVPSRRPAMAILVWIDTPRKGGTYGGVIAGPIFQRIASEALRLLGVPPDVNPAAPVLVRRDGGSEIRVAGPPQPLTILPAAPTNGDVVLPELRGMGAREALRVLGKLGLSARVNGNGIVLEQEPPAGSVIEPGGSCRLALGRSLPKDTAAAGGLHP